MADMCSPDTSGNHVGVAFGLVTASGLATSLGAAAAFWMPFPKPGATSNPWLAASLGAAAGVMVYVSFVEIFVAKSVVAFEACIDRSEVAYLYATLCFFGGVLLTVAFDQVLHIFERWAQRRLQAKQAAAAAAEADAEGAPAAEGASDSVVLPADAGDAEAVDVVPALGGVVVATPVIHCHPSAAGGDGVELDAEGARSRVAQASHPSDSSNWTEFAEGARSSSADEGTFTAAGGVLLLTDEDKARQEAMQPIADSTGHGGLLQPSLLESAKAKKDLVRMGAFAGIALAAHNFPEGLATFIAALQDPGVGVSVAVAIGIHKYVRALKEGLFGPVGVREGCGLGEAEDRAATLSSRAAVACWPNRLRCHRSLDDWCLLSVSSWLVFCALYRLLTAVALSLLSGRGVLGPVAFHFFLPPYDVVYALPCSPPLSGCPYLLVCSTASPRALPLPCQSTMRRGPSLRPSSGPPCQA